jgi:Transcriptional accessory protein
LSENFAGRIADELKIPIRQVAATMALLEEGCTIPFIARYRKEATGTLDEVAVTAIRDNLARLVELEKRREAILGSLKERELLTPELESKITAATTLTELEDIYLPYRPKRRTRATVAREKGLEPLADAIFAYKCDSPEKSAEAYISEEKGVATVEDALAGARDIIAENVSEDVSARKEMRRHWNNNAYIDSVVGKGKEEAGAKFKDYFDWEEPARKAPSHRVLAIFRGESEDFLKVSIRPDAEPAVELFSSRFVKGNSPCAKQIRLAVEDAYKRLLAPSMETELRAALKAEADTEAIKVFAMNLRELLMSPPLGDHNVLAIDPGFRTGCKVVCLNKQAELLHHDVIYPHTEGGAAREKASSEHKVLDLVKKFDIEAIAIGNGTASRETEAFVKGIDFKSIGVEPPFVVQVNESGASIYSASEVAREEFPDHDITVRGAVSIGRRLMDPLAELVKLDPKSIGVGQYQHDVDQGALQSSLDDAVVSCVNSVGVELNTASKELLSYVSGLSKQLATNIVKHRAEKGPFKSRSELKKVARLGPKAFEQCAGFLRIRNGSEALDGSAVHPERYDVVKQMAKDLNCKVVDLIEKQELRKRIDINKYVSSEVGLPTLKDIVAELEKPGRDPRPPLEAMSFAEGVHTMNDLKEGMKLPGVVTNVTAFGCFVDIGVHQDGLVHISELANKFVKDPTEVVKVQQRVEVTVLSVDAGRKRISLSMKR